MEELLREFIADTKESLDLAGRELVRFAQRPDDTGILANVFRLLHTIKGTCGFLSLLRLEALAHAAEALMDRFRGGEVANRATVALILATLDRMNCLLDALERTRVEPAGDDQDLIGALSGVAGTPVMPAAGHGGAKASTPATAPARDVGGHIPLSATECAHGATPAAGTIRAGRPKPFAARPPREVRTRSSDPARRDGAPRSKPQQRIIEAPMEPIGNTWRQLPMLARDLAGELGKDAQLVMTGADTEVDRRVMALIKAPLIHLLRNAIDHGLERPGERRARGKPRTGTISLSAGYEVGRLVITIADDGRGLDTANIKKQVLAQGLAGRSAVEKMTDAEIHQFVFAAGFSTVLRVTSISGRGVGMDVVRTNVERAGGTVEVVSRPGQGTGIVIRLPPALPVPASDPDRIALRRSQPPAPPHAAPEDEPGWPERTPAAAPMFRLGQGTAPMPSMYRRTSQFLVARNFDHQPESPARSSRPEAALAEQPAGE